VKASYLSLSFAAAILGFAVVVQTGLVAPKLGRKTAPKSLQQSLPENLPGWSVEELPIGPTELDSGAISRCLNYDEFIFRRYRFGRDVIFLYLAYWSPQRMPPDAVGGHTPDFCWMGGGWTCEASSFSWTSRLGDKKLLPAQYRLFRNADGRVQHVIYWHLVGGRLFEDDYHIDGFHNQRSNDMHSFFFWGNVLLHRAGANDEQYFVRLSSERPFEEIWDDPGFRTLMESLARLGLGKA
jgi:hypothetical protein